MAEPIDLSVRIHWPSVERSEKTVLKAAFEEGRYPGAELVDPPAPARRKRSRSTKNNKRQAGQATTKEK